MSDRQNPDYRLVEEREKIIAEVAKTDPKLAEDLRKALFTIDNIPSAWKLVIGILFQREFENEYPSVRE